MPELDPPGGAVLEVRPDQPLIGVVVQEDGQEVVRYFADEDAAGSASQQISLERALGAVGSWSDLEFDETLDALDRIRHESTPTPPIEIDV